MSPHDSTSTACNCPRRAPGSSIGWDLRGRLQWHRRAAAGIRAPRARPLAGHAHERLTDDRWGGSLRPNLATEGYPVDRITTTFAFSALTMVPSPSAFER